MRAAFFLAFATTPMLNGALGAQTAVWPVPPEARQTARIDDETGQYSVATGPATLDTPPATLDIDGSRSRVSLVLNDSDLSTFDVARQIETNIEAGGWTVVFSCAQPDCGGYDFRKSRDVIPLPDMFVDLGQFNYLSARPPEDTTKAVEILVSRYGSDIYVQTSQIAGKPPPVAPVRRPSADTNTDTGPTQPSAHVMQGGIGDLLQRDGRIMIDGLQFAEGSTEVDASGSPTIRSLADWLNADRSRRIAVVGHSDWNGSYDANRAVSRARAQSVANLLNSDFGVQTSQMEIHGAAYLAPLAGNTTEADRNRNRRVEAVLLPNGG